MNAPEVSVEVFAGPGLPGLSIVGLVETAIKESRDRVRAAILNSGFNMPDRRIVVSLAPADLPKSGSRYDLAIAIGILCASRQLPVALLESCEFVGELALAGELRAVSGTLPMAMRAVEAGHRIIVPRANEHETGLLENPDVLVANNLQEVGNFLSSTATLSSALCEKIVVQPCSADLSDVIGQARARRALEIVAVGGHHLLMRGPPGTGKSMLAQRLPGLLPAPGQREVLETAAIFSLRGISPECWPEWGTRPFRAPHHTATPAAIAGGGSTPHPGEISLAHNGVLFLDELPEFQRRALEVLREPLETGMISISRAERTVTFPARFQLIAAMNPCPCGYRGDPVHECRCSPDQVKRYRERISGPFLDRMDIVIELSREVMSFSAQSSEESTADVNKRVVKARELCKKRGTITNGSLDGKAIRSWCWPDQRGLALLDEAITKLGLSRRACDRALRVARSIADLAGVDAIDCRHVAEALSYRAT
jgi:magnesium chelatase family protein